MKRLFMLLSLIIAALVIVACEADNGTIYGLIYEERTHEERPYEDAHEKLYEELHYEDELHEAKYEYVEIEGIKRRIMPQGSLTVEHFLEDLAYMVYVLENNFALLDVARWAHGVDYRELAANAREAVVAMEELCEGIFMALVHFHFYPLMITGHFDIFTPTSYDWGISNFYGGYRGRKARMNLELMRSPLAYRFYGSPGARSGFYEGRRQVLGYEPTYNRIMGYFPGGMSEPLHTGVVTEIIEEGRIAYIFTGANMQVLRQQQSAIFNFYRQISDFEHLIIDVRGNLGGNADVFLNVIVRPTLTEAVEAPYVFQFFQDGPYVRRFGDMLFLSTTSSGYLTNLEEYRTAREVLSSNDLPEFNLADIERL
ncbi:MAG: S41 family peptidase, partial [Oscillospiraceae bacterium]|nr:S41 family peptidase [Oscillospiraceae bacterium]